MVTRTRCEPIVSIQLANISDPVDGHRSFGVLMAPDTVVVPGPTDWLDDTTSFEALLATAERDGPGTVERIKVGSATVLGLDTAPGGGVGIMTLTHPAQHEPTVRITDTQAFETALGADPDLWTALETAGAIPPGIRGLPANAVLGPVRDWEQAHRATWPIRNFPHDPGTISVRWCKIIRTCDCAGRWW